MAKLWREVKRNIEDEIDRIWWEEPEEIKKTRLGIYPSGAGVYNQYLGNLYYVHGDLLALAYETAQPLMRQVLDDSDFTLEHCKKIWRSLNMNKCELLDWLNFKKVLVLANDIVESFESIKTKEEFADLFWSWNNYINRLQEWAFFTFPWELALLFQKKEPSDIKELARLSEIELGK